MLIYGECECFIMQMLCLVAVLNAAFYMTCSLFILVDDARGNHMEEAYSRAVLMTALYIAMSVSCLPNPVAVSAFIICRGLCVCAVCEVLGQGKIQNLWWARFHG